MRYKKVLPNGLVVWIRNYFFFVDAINWLFEVMRDVMLGASVPLISRCKKKKTK